MSKYSEFYEQSILAGLLLDYSGPMAWNILIENCTYEKLLTGFCKDIGLDFPSMEINEENAKRKLLDLITRHQKVYVVNDRIALHEILIIGWLQRYLDKKKSEIKEEVMEKTGTLVPFDKLIFLQALREDIKEMKEFSKKDVYFQFLQNFNNKDKASVIDPLPNEQQYKELLKQLPNIKVIGNEVLYDFFYELEAEINHFITNIQDESIPRRGAGKSKGSSYDDKFELSKREKMGVIYLLQKNGLFPKRKVDQKVIQYSTFLGYLFEYDQKEIEKAFSSITQILESPQKLTPGQAPMAIDSVKKIKKVFDIIEMNDISRSLDSILELISKVKEI